MEPLVSFPFHSIKWGWGDIPGHVLTGKVNYNLEINVLKQCFITSLNKF